MVFKFFWQACSSSVPLLAAYRQSLSKSSNTKSFKVINQEQFGFNRYTFGLDYDLKCKWTWQAYRESETPTDCYLKCIEFLMRYIREWVKYYLFMRFPFPSLGLFINDVISFTHFLTPTSSTFHWILKKLIFPHFWSVFYFLPYNAQNMFGPLVAINNFGQACLMLFRLNMFRLISLNHVTD